MGNTKPNITWWRHEMETFSALLSLCEGNPSVIGGFPSQRRVTRSVDAFFDLRLNKRSSKQSRRRWSETLIMTSLQWVKCFCQHLMTNVISRLYINFFQYFSYGYILPGYSSLSTWTTSWWYLQSYLLDNSHSHCMNSFHHFSVY